MSTELVKEMIKETEEFFNICLDKARSKGIENFVNNEQLHKILIKFLDDFRCLLSNSQNQTEKTDLIKNGLNQWTHDQCPEIQPVLKKGEIKTRLPLIYSINVA